jgi:hypothetical protein
LPVIQRAVSYIYFSYNSYIIFLESNAGVVKYMEFVNLCLTLQALDGPTIDLPCVEFKIFVFQFSKIVAIGKNP